MSTQHTEVFDPERAAAELGISKRTLQKKAAAGLLRFETVKQKGHDHRLYIAEDVYRLKREGSEEAQTALVPAFGRAHESVNLITQLLATLQAQQETTAKRDELAIAHERGLAEERQKRWEAEQEMKTLALAEQREQEAWSTKIWLRPSECKRFGMPAAVAIGLAQRGEVTAIKNGKSWLLLRESIEAYRPTAKAKAAGR